MLLQENHIQNVYFLGIGGIGMSALARFFHSRGYQVGGYDRTPSALTKALEEEGISVLYTDDENQIAAWARDREHCLVVRTPAVPETTKVYQYFLSHDFDIRKRAQVLGLVTRQQQALCVAGTHGKTTTSTLLAHLLHQSPIGTNAFLGGISVNYQTNLLLDKKSNLVVVEADEYDRSFHQLTPYMSVITSADADHLDIYGTEQVYRESFEHYSSLIENTLVIKHGIAIHPRLQEGVKCYTYLGEVPAGTTSLPDFYASNIVVENATIRFDFVTPTLTMHDMQLGVPVWVNIENSVAAMAVAWLNGVDEEHLRDGLRTFRGVQRRFNVHVSTPRIAYVDDYAHHPAELQAAISSIRRVWADRYVIGIFQPHLYTRTRDFAKDFARVLSQVDELILLPIYPARELPIEGVHSEMLLSLCTQNEANRSVVEKQNLIEHLSKRIQELEKPIVVMTLGAGDIDRLVEPITQALSQY